jgi:hypothetical protein
MGCLHCRDKERYQAGILVAVVPSKRRPFGSKRVQTSNMSFYGLVVLLHESGVSSLAATGTVLQSTMLCWRLEIIVRISGIRLGRCRIYTKGIRIAGTKDAWGLVRCQGIMELVDGLVYWHDERGLGASPRESFGRDGYVSIRPQPDSEWW